MRVTQTFPSYNQRRYGRPWIAKVVDWPIGKNAVLEFGGLVGLTAEIDAKPGQIVRWGQRDNRGNNTTTEWGIVAADGAINDATPERCRDHWLAGCQVLPAAAECDNVVSFARGEG